jgi:LPS export ABC transporter protein LptC
MMRRVTIRKILLIAILAVAFGLGLRMWTHRREPVIEPPAASLPTDTDLSLQDIQYTETSDGVRRWSLTAKTAAYDTGQGKSSVRDMRLVFFDEHGGEQAVLTAREGSWVADTGEVEARDNVIVKTTDGYTLRTEFLRYRSETDEVSTEQAVRVESGRMQLSARGMRYGIKARSLTLHSQVKAIFAGGIGN